MAYKQGAEVDGVGGAGAVQYIQAGTTVTGSQDVKALETSVIINNKHLSLTGAVGEFETPATLYLYSGVEGGNNIQADANQLQINAAAAAYLNGSTIAELAAESVGLSGSASIALHSELGSVQLSASSGTQITGSLGVDGTTTLGTTNLGTTSVQGNLSVESGQAYAVMYGTTIENSGSVSVNLNNGTSQIFFVNATNVTMSNPTNGQDGGVYNFIFKQDETGSRALTFGSKYLFPGGTLPTLTEAANAVDVVSCIYTGDVDGGSLLCSAVNNFSSSA